MKHDGPVIGAQFNRNESLVLTWSEDGTARLWDYTSADYDFPKKYLPLLVEVATGTIIDEYGNVSALGSKEWSERKKRYAKIAEEHLKTCRYRDANLYRIHKRFYGEE